MPLRARNKLVVDHLHLVGAATAFVVARLTQAPRDDLAAAGSLALVRAAEKFDNALGIPFAAFARERINWALMDELRALDWAPKDVRARAKATVRVRETLAATLGRPATILEIAEAMGVDASAVTESLADADRLVVTLELPEVEYVPWTGYLPDEVAVSSERDEFLHHAIEALPDRRRYIIRAIYFEDRTVKDLADELGVSHAAISQQRSEAIRMLRSALDRQYPDDAVSADAPATRAAASVRDAYFERIAATGKRFARALLPQAVDA